jgi:hypothetical protein
MKGHPPSWVCGVCLIFYMVSSLTLGLFFLPKPYPAYIMKGHPPPILGVWCLPNILQLVFLEMGFPFILQQ